jgi:hypothetical protein
LIPRPGEGVKLEKLFFIFNWLISPTRDHMKPRPSPQSDRDLVAVHSSDLHIDDVTNRPGASDGLDMLTAVLTAGRRHQADVILLAGDTFESHRLPPALIEQSAAILADSKLTIAILPGNHDPVIPEAVYHQRSLREIDNVHVLGVTCPDALLFSHLDLEIWGRPHFGYDDMFPFERVRPRRTRWQIALGHGHYESAPDLTRHRGHPGSSAMRILPAPRLTTSHWGIGIAPQRSDIRPPPTTPARRIMRNQSMSSDFARTAKFG